MLFRAMIQGEEADDSFYQVYWAHGDHLGDALPRIRAEARDNGVEAPVFVNADPFDIENLPDELGDVSGQDVFSTGRIYFPRTETFEFPCGIVPSWVEGPHDPQEIRDGYAVNRAADGMVKIEVNVSGPKLRPLYYALIREWGDFRVFWYRIHTDYEHSEQGEMMVNETLSTAEAIIDHLEANALDSLDNGLCTLTAYVPEGGTNLNISDHKKIVVLTYDEANAARAIKFLDSHGYEKTEPFLTIDADMHHRHYRPEGSRDRPSLIEHLTAQGFKPWQPNG